MGQWSHKASLYHTHYITHTLTHTHTHTHTQAHAASHGTISGLVMWWQVHMDNHQPPLLVSTAPAWVSSAPEEGGDGGPLDEVAQVKIWDVVYD